MAAIKHSKVSALPDDPDTTLVRPSDWNADHTIEDEAITLPKLAQITALKILGNNTGSAAQVQEIACTAAGFALLDDADAAAQRTTLGLAALAVKATVATADIDNDAVTYAKIQNVATDRLLGRDTAGSGDTEELTVGGGVEFTGSGGIQRSALTGDVTASAGSNATTIPNDTVTYAKMQNVSGTDKLLGRSTAGAGDVEEITCTAAGRALLDDADATAQRATLGLGTAAVENVIDHYNEYFGSGVDGSLHFDGASTVTGFASLSLAPAASVYTLTRDIFCTDCTIDVGVTVKNDGYRIFCTGTFTCNGKVTCNGIVGSNGTAAGGAGGTAAVSAFRTYICNSTSTGGGGGTGAGTNATNMTGLIILGAGSNTSHGQNGGTLCGGGGGNGSSGNGANSGAGGSFNPQSGAGWNTIDEILTAASITNQNTTNPGHYTTGGAGAGGGGSTTQGGGGGGSGGGVIGVFARTIAGSGSLECKGANGGNGSASGNTGGGGGGAGGRIGIITRSTSLSITLDVSGGTGGTKGGTGENGGNGGSGVTRTFVV